MSYDLPEHMKHGKDKKGLGVFCTWCSFTASDGLLCLLRKLHACAHTVSVNHAKDIICTVTLCVHTLFGLCMR